jgi:hypothetical protein
MQRRSKSNRYSNRLINSMEAQNAEICHECLGNAHVRGRLREIASAGACAYCLRPSSHCWRIVAIAAWLVPQFKNHFDNVIFSAEPIQLASPVETILTSALDIPDRASHDLRIVMWKMNLNDANPEDPEEFTEDELYVLSGRHLTNFEREWSNLQEIAQHKGRYFNESVAGFFRRLFVGVLNLHDQEERPLVDQIDQDCSIFRARIARERSELSTIILGLPFELAAPSGRLARAGRLNAAGISVFYGAFDRKTCIAEVRPPVGSSVVIGEFKALRKLSLLNLARLRSLAVNEKFLSPGYSERSKQFAYLRGIANKFSLPVMPGGEEFDYLLSQMAFEFLGSVATPQLDGIIYPSVQMEGDVNNIALFERSSAVRDWSDIDLNWISYTDGPYPEGGNKHRVHSSFSLPPSAADSFDSMFDEPTRRSLTNKDLLPSLSLPMNGVEVLRVGRAIYEGCSTELEIEAPIRADDFSTGQ